MNVVVSVFRVGSVACLGCTFKVEATHDWDLTQAQKGRKSLTDSSMSEAEQMDVGAAIRRAFSFLSSRTTGKTSLMISPR